MCAPESRCLRSATCSRTTSFMVSWDFPFADKSEASFADVVLQKEPEVAPNLRKLGPFLGGEKAAKAGAGNQPAEGGGDGPAEPLMFHGIFPVRSAGGGAPSRYRVLVERSPRGGLDPRGMALGSDPALERLGRHGRAELPGPLPR